MDIPTQEGIKDRLAILNRANENFRMATTAYAKRSTQKALHSALKWFTDHDIGLCLTKGLNEEHYIIAPPVIESK